MRPVTLRLDGFRSYASEIEIDWTDRRLIGIVGPIGSGKSTILDAVCFALYGKTPTEKSNQKSLIHQRADVGKVEFVFDVEGVRWKSTRALRRKGQSAHALYRVDPYDPDGDALETVLGKSEVDTRLEEILGVDFDGFNRSVMLAQGRFSDFLQSTNTDRDKVLKGVFGLDKIDAMESIAKRIRDGAKRDLEEFGRDRANLNHVKELAARAATNLKAATDRHVTLLTREPIVETCEETVRASEGEIARANEQTESLKALAESLPESGRSQQIFKEHATKASELAVATARAKELAVAQEVATQERKDLFETIGGSDRLGVARQQAARLGDAQAAERRELARRDDAQTNVAEAVALVGVTTAIAESAEAAAEAAKAKTATATEALQGADQALHEGRHADMAASLRAELVTNGVCPVCDQSVAQVPKRSKAGTALAKLETARERAELNLTEATDAEKLALAAAAKGSEAVLNATTRLDQAQSAATTAEQAHKSASAAAAEIEQSLIVILGKQPVDRLTEVEERLKGIDIALHDLALEKKKADMDVERCQTQVEDAQGDLRRLTSTVAKLASQLDVAYDDLVDASDTDQLLKKVRDVWLENQKAVMDARQAAVHRLAAATKERAEAMESAGLSPDDDFGKAVTGAAVAVASAQSELAVYNETLARSTDLDDRIVGKQDVVALYDDLAKDLRPAAFLGYLLEEERAELGRVSSEQFEQLSGGRYRFSDDAEFNILDLNAAELVRKASTLSGGETFLASLALALALAEMVARGSGRLDSFFLDEGFGSLDAEHLDLAMAGIESLVAGHDERLVVIVSHVPDMKDRIEDLIVLDKDATTGATIVLRS